MAPVLQLHTGRQRPTRLSNQNCCYSDSEVRLIDTKEVDELGWRDFSIIFTISGCTSKYDEQIYYLPLALQFLFEHPNEGKEFLPDIVYFISNAEPLRRDGLLDEINEAVRTIFRHWSADFKVVHFDKPACQAKGWKVDHSDYVINSDSLRDLIDSLLRYQSNKSFAEELLEWWRRPGRGDLDSAWLLEFSKEERKDYEYYSRTYPGKDRENTPTKFSEIYKTVSNQVFLQTELDRIRFTLVENEPSPTYWPDLIKSLELAA